MDRYRLNFTGKPARAASRLGAATIAGAVSLAHTIQREAPRLALGSIVATGFGVAGLALVSVAGVALPGAVAGLLFLLGAIRLSPAVAAGAGALFDRVSQHIFLMFVPAGSGIVTGANALAEDWPVVAFAILLGTPLAIGVVALLANLVFGRGARTSGGGTR
jgi:holin-like protein